MTYRRPASSRTYWILRPDQIAAVASPLRQEIVDSLAGLGPQTVKTLALALRRRPTAIYHHLRPLIRAGLVRSRSHEGNRGRPALAYETVAPRMRLARAARDARNHKPMARAGTAAAKQAGRDYAAGFQPEHAAIEGSGRNHWFFRVVATPSPQRLKRINALLDELAELSWTPDANPGPPMSIAWFLAPLAGTRRNSR